MSEREREAAHIISALLSATLRQAEREQRHLYWWERHGIEWLREQWRRDPDTIINMWTADRYVRNEKIDLFAKTTAEMP